MWPLALIPLYALHGVVHHYVMNSIAPFYQAFDTFTKHCWIGRATSFATQIAVLPLMAYFGQSSAYHHVLGMYILSDSIHMTLYMRDDVLSWVHHILCSIGYFVMMFVSEEVVSIMVTGSLILELTSPLIHLCWFVNKSGYSQTRWFPYLAGLTLLNFFVVRCVWFPYFVLHSLPKMLWGFGVVLMALNVMWFYKLIGYANVVVRKAGGSRLE